MRINQANIFKNAAYRMKSSSEVKNKFHTEKYLHIHDKEYYNVTYNCLGVEFKSEIIENLTYEENLENNLDKLFEEISNLTNEQSGGIGYINIDKDLSKVFEFVPIEKAIREVRRFFRKLNLPLRNGYEKAYITFNLGLDESVGGTKVIESFLMALKLGNIENSEPFIFPNIVFKVKKGVNRELLNMAASVSGIRMNPTYFNCDSKNLFGISPDKVGIMGCRTLLVKNINGEDGGLRRGNIAAISINLPKIALESNSLDIFFNKLKFICNESKEILLDRYKVLCNCSLDDMNYIIKNNLYLGSEKAKKLEDIFSNGTLSIGFIGLYDAISYLKKQEINLNFIRENIEFGEKILKFMRGLTDSYSEKYKLNFSLLGSSGEGISKRFTQGDKEFYTNSFHVPVNIEISPFEKLKIESRFVKYCNGGEISYIEFKTPVIINQEAIIDILDYAISQEHIYIGINFPLDFCLDCKTTGVFKDNCCDKCQSKNIKRIRRVSGYLSLKENLNEGKKAEEKARISHL